MAFRLYQIEIMFIVAKWKVFNNPYLYFVFLYLTLNVEFKFPLVNEIIVIFEWDMNTKLSFIWV